MSGDDVKFDPRQIRHWPETWQDASEALGRQQDRIIKATRLLVGAVKGDDDMTLLDAAEAAAELIGVQAEHLAVSKATIQLLELKLCEFGHHGATMPSKPPNGPWVCENCEEPEPDFGWVDANQRIKQLEAEVARCHQLYPSLAVK